MEKYTIFLLLALLSEIIGTVSGFGSSILFVPLASVFFDFKTVLGVTAVFHVFSNISKIVLFNKGINKDIALKLGIPAILFVLIGALITTKIQVQKMELLMNFALVVLSVYLIVNINKKLKQTNFNLIAGGSISGLLAGLVGTGGAVRGITIAAFNLPKDVFIATSAIIDLGVDVSRSVVYVANDYFPKSLVVLIPFLIGISIIGSYLGKVILKYTSEKVFRYIVLIVIVVTSVVQTTQYIWG
ncbi:MAG: hypothetical protein JWQ38_3327 [Flavipsychrobacter sp.]|nr:hypothetical protein [Flavipsychrobacter sp.]